MDINRIILWIMAFGVVLGGLDSMLGNRFGYGEKFENGFRMLGSVGLSMAGIICLAPVAASVLGVAVEPVCRVLGLDPGIFGSFLAIDMGGYSLALELAKEPRVGQFAGIVVSSIFGCTMVFSIPVGFGIIREEDRVWFTKGILLGLTSMPVSLTVGGLVMGLELGCIVWNSLPVFLISGLLAVGAVKFPGAMMKGFRMFAEIIRVAAILGLTLAAVNHLTGISVFPAMPPLQEAMDTVSAICIVMLGCLPLAELLQRLLKVGFGACNGAGTTALLLGLVSGTPALALIPEMNNRSKVVVSACLVSGMGIFGSHFAFAGSVAPETVPAMLAAKLVGGILGGVIAWFCTREV